MAQPLNKRVQFVRGTTSQNDSYVGPMGQLTVDVERKEFRLHDGLKAGGWRFVNLDQLRRLFLTRDTEFGQVDFADEQVGILVRTGDRVYQLREVAGADGIRIVNPDLVAGDLTVGLPTRLQESLPVIADANLATDTGFYVVQAGAMANLPVTWLTTVDVFLEVYNYEDTVNGTILQLARNTQTQDFRVYERRRLAGAWTDWATSPVVTIPNGAQTELIDGVRQEARLWSPADLTEFIRQAVSSIQYIDSTNVAKAFSYNELFAVSGVGADVTSQTVGPFNLATNDRVELVASATAKNQAVGDSQFAKIEVERTDLSFDVLSNVNIAALANQGPNSISTRVRIIKTATGYQTADDNWALTGANVAATLTGRFRVTVGALNTIGARGARYR